MYFFLLLETIYKFNNSSIHNCRDTLFHETTTISRFNFDAHKRSANFYRGG